MKRRYKPGDWFAVPLDAVTNATGLVTHMAGTRLFAYFFESGRKRDAACARFLCSAQALDDLRWPLIPAPVRADLSQFPLPDLGERGAFGRSWWRRTLDAQTLQTRARTTSERSAVHDLPPAQILTAADVEGRLRELLLGIQRDPPCVICEVRAPLDVRSLDVLAAGGAVQLSQAVQASVIAQLHAALENASPVALRLHAMDGEPFDLRALAAWPSLVELSIDTANISRLDALHDMVQLQQLRIARDVEGISSVLPVLANLRTLITSAPVTALPRALTTLELIAVRASPALLAHTALAHLTIAHSDAADVVLPPTLRWLELRDMRLRALPDLSRAQALHTLVLRRIRGLKDLSALHHAPVLRLVVIQEMPQLHVDDFKPLAGTPLCFDLALGNRTMTREVYRLLGSGHRSVRARVVQ